jgi:hypothetical protein
MIGRPAAVRAIINIPPKATTLDIGFERRTAAASAPDTAGIRRMPLASD